MPANDLPLRRLAHRPRSQDSGKCRLARYALPNPNNPPGRGITGRLTKVGRLLENSSKPCDTGSSIGSIAPDFPSVDFSFVDPIYPDKTSESAKDYHYTRESILNRGQRALSHLYQRKEKLIIVFTHSAFLRAGVVGWWFYNADYRIFDFIGDPMETNDWAHNAIKQDERTISGGLGKSGNQPKEVGVDL